MLYMQHFISKISAKNVFIIIKTCSASGGPPSDPSFRGFAPNPHQGGGSAPGPRWGTSVHRPPNCLPRLFSFPRMDRRGLVETLFQLITV